MTRTSRLSSLGLCLNSRLSTVAHNLHFPQFPPAPCLPVRLRARLRSFMMPGGWPEARRIQIWKDESPYPLKRRDDEPAACHCLYFWLSTLDSKLSTASPNRDSEIKSKILK